MPRGRRDASSAWFRSGPRATPKLRPRNEPFLESRAKKKALDPTRGSNFIQKEIDMGRTRFIQKEN
jgi:hypothetical protein